MSILQSNTPRRPRALTVLAVLFLMVTVMTSARSSWSEGGIPIFTPAGSPDVSADALPRAVPSDPTVIRSRLVRINFAPLAGADLPPGDESIVLNLFDDVTLTAVKDRLETLSEGRKVWYGHIKDRPGSYVILVFHGQSMAGNIFLPQAQYQIRGVVGDLHSVREIDQSKFQGCKDAVPVVPVGGIARDEPKTQGDSAATIDVLVVYTPAAAASSTDIHSEIALAVAESNQSYLNSNVVHRINLVGAFQVLYAESGDMGTDLERLKGTADGYMDGVHSLRDQYFADCVVLITKPNDLYCGIAYQYNGGSGFDPWAFAVVGLDCATGYYSFAHELGHNMGLRHDCYTDQQDDPFDYITYTENGHGYVDTANAWRTIMAYNRQCSDLGFDCTRVQYFSNPNVTYLGDPTGSPASGGDCTADSRTRLMDTDFTVANFRDSTAYLDSDADGVPDTVDDYPTDDSRATTASASGTGKITVDVSAVGGALRNVTPQTDTNPVYDQSTKPSGMEFPHGLVSFEVHNAGFLDGVDYTFTITYPMDIPTGATFYKVNAGNDFVEYPSGMITIGVRTVTITIENNGPFDLNASDAVISDPGGVVAAAGSTVPGTGGTTTSVTTEGGGGGGGGGCFIQSTFFQD